MQPVAFVPLLLNLKYISFNCQFYIISEAKERICNYYPFFYYQYLPCFKAKKAQAKFKKKPEQAKLFPMLLQQYWH